jgi:putative ATP-binding cassette transporter
MPILKILSTAIGVEWRRILLAMILASGANVTVMAIINLGTKSKALSWKAFGLAISLLALVAVFAYLQRLVLMVVTAEVDTIMHKIRTRVLDKLARCELLAVESIGRQRLYAALGKEVEVLSVSSMQLVTSIQALSLAIISLTYLAFLSISDFVLMIVWLTLAIMYHFKRFAEVNREVHYASNLENKLQDVVTDVLDGFKEAKMERVRLQAIRNDAVTISSAACDIRVKTQATHARDLVFIQGTFLLLLGAIVFIAPIVTSRASADGGTHAITVILFMLGAIFGAVGSVPALTTANASAENITSVEAEIDALLARSARRQTRAGNVDSVWVTMPKPSQSIVMNGVTFTHRDQHAEHGFVVGPIDLKINIGEITFITGGNGSGKSTLIKLLTALYPPQAGVILLDGQPIAPHNEQAYRDLFGTVFSDYHLFSRGYAMPVPTAAVIEERLEYYGLTGKTQFSDGCFWNNGLSSGQRRRLALLIARLQDKQIYVLDEWAADQDPHFRAKFYHEILPEMKSEGKTIIAVTHDDRFFSVCDKHIHIEGGRIHAN